MNTKENILAFKDFRLNAPKYLKQVAEGKSFLVIKRSRPAFRIEPVNEIWETIGDFSKMPGGGVSIDVLLKALKK